MSQDNNEPKEVNIFVLETDEPHPETHERKGTYGQIFHELFTEAGAKHDPPLRVNTSMHCVVDDPSQNKHGHVPKASEIPDDIHAILLSGSMYDAHGNDEWVIQLRDLLTEIWNTRPDMKFSGVCFGHQMLARVLGGKVEASPGKEWELAHTELNLSPIGQKLFRTEEKTLALVQMHQDQVTKIPSHRTSNGMIDKDAKVHIWASSDHTRVQGLYIRDRLFTSQGHLGFDEKMVKRNVEMRQESGGIECDVEAQEAKDKAHLKHDGLIVASAIVRFFHGEDHNVD